MTRRDRLFSLAFACMAATALGVAPAHAASAQQQQPVPPQSATPGQPAKPPGNSQVTHSGVIPPPPVGDSGINKGAPPPQDFPTPVIHPPPNPSPTPSTH